MRLIISVPFFDTEKNNRARVTEATLRWLRGQVHPPHVVVPVDNGSEDTAVWEWLQEESDMYPHALRIPKPMSVAQGVNTGWRLFEDELMQGEAVACKHDSDMFTDDGWVEEVVSAIRADTEHQIGLIGPYMRILRPPEGKPQGSWIEQSFIHGAVAARTPWAFRQIGYCRNPHGRWGWQDHWDVRRIDKLGLICAVFHSVETHAITGSAAFSREEKKDMIPAGSAALQKLLGELDSGTRDIFEPFDGHEP